VPRGAPPKAGPGLAREIPGLLPQGKAALTGFWLCRMQETGVRLPALAGVGKNVVRTLILQNFF